jgi:hypothetical protein
MQIERPLAFILSDASIRSAPSLIQALIIEPNNKRGSTRFGQPLESSKEPGKTSFLAPHAAGEYCFLRQGFQLPIQGKPGRHR